MIGTVKIRSKWRALLERVNHFIIISGWLVRGRLTRGVIQDSPHVKYRASVETFRAGKLFFVELLVPLSALPSVLGGNQWL